MTNKHENIIPHHTSLDNCNLKLWDSPTYLLEGPKPKTLTYFVGKGREDGDL